MIVRLSSCFVVAAFILLSAVISVPSFAADSILQGAHGDTDKMPKSCRACHRGMRITVTGEEGICLECHGDTTSRSRMLAKGYLSASAGLFGVDMRQELSKPYRHPTLLVANVHRQSEHLPEDQVNAARHAECVDCHDPHKTSADRPLAGIKGARVGSGFVEIAYEYELCYKCHAESANLPGDSTNKHAEFKTTNPSYHPVEGEGANSFVISLKEPYVGKAERPSDVSIITCGDCHGNDNPDGPKGPHGSNYEGLLVEHYETGDGLSESEYAYALCYKCHDRVSILGNESFPEHARHIVGQASPGGGTSCKTCHDAHGSTRYTSLLRFNEEVVEPASNGRIEYRQTIGVAGSGSCTLSCHGVDHIDKKY